MAMGSLGRLTRIEDLPANKQMLDLFGKAVSFIRERRIHQPHRCAAEGGESHRPRGATEFTKALKANKRAFGRLCRLQPQLQKRIY